MPHLADHFSRSITITSGDGVRLTDNNGKSYIDFVAGWCVANIGYRNPKVVSAMQHAAATAFHAPHFLRYQPWEDFATKLCEIAPGELLTRVYRCTSGSEAVEFAIKCARATTGKPTIISVDGVYHGHTLGAAALGDACTRSMAPCPPGFIKIPLPHRDFGSNAEKSFEAFMHIIETRNDIAAFMSEPFWSNAGVYAPPPDFLSRIQYECRKRNILFIMDEVATGFGRTGKLFASEWQNLEPDIMCLAKALTGGYGVMGATLVSEHVYRRSLTIPTYTTFGWNAIDLAAAQANLQVILDERLWEKATQIGRVFEHELRPLENYNGVGEIRGSGALWGVSIVGKILGTKAYLRTQAIAEKAALHGLIVETAGNSLFISPPLVMSDKDVQNGTSILKSVL
jgi:4-aminobutyrate aminotransferase-like enzyme